MVKCFARFVGGFLGIVAASSGAEGVLVAPGQTVALSPVAPPTGQVVDSRSVTSDVIFPAMPGTVAYHATLATTVVRDVDSTLAFMQRLHSDSTAEVEPVDGIRTWSISGFSGYLTDAGFLDDSLLAPTLVSRSADGDVLTFSSFPTEFVTSTSPSTTLVIRTSADDYGLNSRIHVRFRDILGEMAAERPIAFNEAEFLAAGPTRIPEPSSLAFMLLAVLAGVMRTPRR